MLDWINLAGLVAILGTLFGIMMPMIRNTEKRLDAKIDKLDARIDKVDSKVDGLAKQIIEIHIEIAGLYRRMPAQPELVVATAPGRRRAA